MKLKTLMISLTLASITMTASAFQVQPTGDAKIDRHMTKVFYGYEIEFEYFGKMMTVRCPIDGGLTTLSITKAGASVVKSTDTCKHEVVFEVPGFKIYKDDIPFLLADDYTAWKKSHADSMFQTTWDKYAK